MAVELKRYRFTRADYHRMAETGILKPDAQVELIEGAIIEKYPVSRQHLAAVDRLTRIFGRSVGDDTIVRIQGSIVLSDDGEPEPDVVLLRYREDFYASDPATEHDVLLIVEVADTSKHYDRTTKWPLYARHGIPELWIADLNRHWITRFADPTPEGYATTRVYRRGESLSPLAFPNLVVTVESVLG